MDCLDDPAHPTGTQINICNNLEVRTTLAFSLCFLSLFQINVCNIAGRSGLSGNTIAMKGAPGLQ